MTGWINQQILRLDISVHHTMTMDVIQRSQELICIQLDQKGMNLLGKLFEMLLNSIDIGGDVVHDDVQKRVFFLFTVVFQKSQFLFLLCWFRFGFLLINEVGVTHPNNVLMVHLFMYL